MVKLRLAVLIPYGFVTFGAILLQQLFVSLFFERSQEHLAQDLATGLPVVGVGVVLVWIWLGRYLGPVDRFLGDPGSVDGPGRLGLQHRLAKVPQILMLTNLGLFLGSALAVIGIQALGGHPLPLGLDFFLILSLNLAFGFMATLQEMSWIEARTVEARRRLGLTSTEGTAPEMRLGTRLFLVNLGGVLLSGLLAGMAALGFYREVVAYYTGLMADAVSAASAVSTEAVDSNEVKVVVQMGLQFAGVLAWIVVLTVTALGNLTRQLRTLGTRVGEMAGGEADLGRRAEVVFFDEVGLLTGRINALMERLQTVVTAIRSTSSQVTASAALVQKTSQATELQLDEVQNSRNSAVRALEGQGEALQATLGVAQSLEGSSAEVRRATEAQNEAVTRGAAAMDQMATSVAEVTQLTSQADALATGLRQTSEQGGKSIAEVRSSIEAIEAAARAVAGTVASIKKTASQTNLLAMNAAIEAAHAGSSGLGFAVVASEVRNLAENSSQGAKTIAELMKDMDAKIAEGDRLARGAGEAFTRIFDLVVQTSEVMGTVARAMDEQKAGTETVLATTRTLREASAHIGTITHQQAGYSQEINRSVMVLLEAGAVLKMAQDVQSRAMTELTGLVSTVAREADQNSRAAGALDETLAGFTGK